MGTKQKFITETEALKIEIAGWKSNIDSMSGTFQWDKDSKDVVIIATPNWIEDGVVPFAFQVFGAKDDYVDYGGIDFRDVSGNLDLQIHLYKEKLIQTINFIKNDLK